MKSLIFGLQIALLVFSAYWLVISLFGFGKPRKLRDKPPQKKFALLVAAHNEEDVVGNLLDNLLALDYPKDMYEVFLIADHCTDRTALIGFEKGVTVLEHWYLVGEPRGKPYALQYAIEQLRDRLGTEFDAVCIFDADNLVSLNYLKEMNNHLLNGEKLIQCYLDSKNPDDNWITLGYTTSFYYMNRSWQLAKSRLGLSNSIGGTGFCVDANLLKEVGWTAKSLTEDLEFTVQCVLRGIRATWAHYTRIYDEKPTGFKASSIQRLRWARGHWDVCFRYTPKLLWRAIRHLDMCALDFVLYLLNPGKIVLSTAIGLTLYMSVFFHADLGRFLLPWYVWVPWFVYNVGYVIYCFVKDGESKFGWIRAMFSTYLLSYCYVPLFVWAFATARKKVWKRTLHTRGLVLNDMSRENLSV